MNERLEEIKENWNNVVWGIDKSDINWLIEQAEQMENLKNAFDDLDSDYIDLVKQNKRYREFLEDMCNHAYGLQLYPHVVDKIKKLLEESE